MSWNSVAGIVGMVLILRSGITRQLTPLRELLFLSGSALMAWALGQ